ncbi:hypothetical protein ACQKLN_30465 [Paenibacillus glucanolyticus]|uniref:hypothetical protein n=1 Tax=Paenibacillus glucanolyticus TaxID=59843 RepID=UPI0036BAA36B
MLPNSFDIVFEHPDLSEWLIYHETTVDDKALIHRVIRNYIDEGFYIFIKLDRYFFPGGIEYGKRHFEHPSLIYGYDHINNSYLLLENCITPTMMQPYSLPYQAFEMSFTQTWNDGRGSVLRCYKVRERLSTINYEIQPEVINRNIQFLLKNCLEKDESNHQYTGLWAIETFADHLQEYMNGLRKEDHLQEFSNLRKCSELQKRHLWVIDELTNNRRLLPQMRNILKEELHCLIYQWDEFRSMYIKSLINSELSHKAHDVNVLKDCLKEIKHLEEKYSLYLLNAIS